MEFQACKQISVLLFVLVFLRISILKKKVSYCSPSLMIFKKRNTITFAHSPKFVRFWINCICGRNGRQIYWGLGRIENKSEGNQRKWHTKHIPNPKKNKTTTQQYPRDDFEQGCPRANCRGGGLEGVPGYLQGSPTFRMPSLSSTLRKFAGNIFLSYFT